MSAFWSYFWPAIGLGLAIGIMSGAFAFRAPRIPTRDRESREPIALLQWRRRRMVALAIGIVAAIAAAALWHGPAGGADRFSASVQQGIQKTLVYYEMTQVTGHLHHGPLTRRVLLSGSADDFQRSELVRLINQVPGVESTTWSSDGGGLPLIAEGAIAAIVGFLLGLVLAYLVELRRRYNAQWKW